MIKMSIKTKFGNCNIDKHGYYIKGKRKSIYSVDIDVLERKVKSKGLPWIKFEEEKKTAKNIYKWINGKVKE